MPPGLALDLYNGEAWISLVAFTIARIRPRFLPAFAPVSTFDEANVRTYVKHNGMPGVYFLSLEGGKRLACAAARALSGLPYRFSNIARKEGLFLSTNKTEGERLKLVYETGPVLTEKSELDLWLTERYAIFHPTKRGVFRYDARHPEWELRAANLRELQVDYPRFRELMAGPPAAAHYSPGARVLAWPKVICPPDGEADAPSSTARNQPVSEQAVPLREKPR